MKYGIFFIICVSALAPHTQIDLISNKEGEISIILDKLINSEDSFMHEHELIILYEYFQIKISQSPNKKYFINNEIEQEYISNLIFLRILDAMIDFIKHSLPIPTLDKPTLILEMLQNYRTYYSLTSAPVIGSNIYHLNKSNISMGKNKDGKHLNVTKNIIQNIRLVRLGLMFPSISAQLNHHDKTAESNFLMVCMTLLEYFNHFTEEMTIMSLDYAA